MRNSEQKSNRKRHPSIIDLTKENQQQSDEKGQIYKDTLITVNHEQNNSFKRQQHLEIVNKYKSQSPKKSINSSSNLEAEKKKNKIKCQFGDLYEMTSIKGRKIEIIFNFLKKFDVQFCGEDTKGMELQRHKNRRQLFKYVLIGMSEQTESNIGDNQYKKAYKVANTLEKELYKMLFKNCAKRDDPYQQRISMLKRQLHDISNEELRKSIVEGNLKASNVAYCPEESLMSQKAKVAELQKQQQLIRQSQFGMNRDPSQSQKQQEIQSFDKSRSFFVEQEVRETHKQKSVRLFKEIVENLEDYRKAFVQRLKQLGQEGEILIKQNSFDF